MEMTEDQIKNAIADKRIRSITLDTSVFDGNGNRFEHGLLARLNQFNGTEVDFVLSDVVLGEVRRHVVRDAAEAKSKVNAALKEVGKAWQVSTEQRAAVVTTLFGNETPEDLADRRLREFSQATQLEVIESSGRINVTEMLGAYFASKPPFGKSAIKKNEFPDAIALQALETWAKEQGQLLLAVSKDGDWERYCKASEVLVAVDDLAKALSYFHQNAEVACARLVQRIEAGTLSIDNELSRAVSTAVDRINFVPEVTSGYFFDAEAGEVNLLSASLRNDAHLAGPFRIVDKPDEDVLVVEAQVEVTAEVTAHLVFSIVDSIDKDEVTIGGASPTTKVTMNMKVLLTFEGDLSADASLVEVEVETPSRSVYVDFGDVGPDWDPDPDDDL